MGGEFRTKGANVLLGPVVGPMGRTGEYFPMLRFSHDRFCLESLGTWPSSWIIS